MSKTDETRQLLDMFTDPALLKKEHTVRRRMYDYLSVPHKEAPEHLANGWTEDQLLKTRTRLRRDKPHDAKLRNRVWCLLYRLGYPELSSGDPGQVLPHRKRGNEEAVDVAVLARDSETVLAVRCESLEAPGERDLEDVLADFDSRKGTLAASINHHYGKTRKHKIVWILVTQNIVWSERDTSIAQERSIHSVTERELGYYEQLASHLGPAARFQFLAEFLAGQQIPALSGRKVPAIRGKLGGRTYYSLVITPKELFKIAFVNHRTLNDPNAVPTYQRLVARSRIRNIASFIEEGGYFPTNLLINFKVETRFEIVQRDDDTNVTYGYLYLPDTYKSAWVVDGQHRLYGFSGLNERHMRQNLLVVAFDRLPSEEEAKLFVTINHEQKSVPRTLLDDLQGDLHWGSSVPVERLGALAARVISQLNEGFGRPFYNRVARQGIPATAYTCLTIPALRQGLMASRLLGGVERTRQYQPGPLTGADDGDTLQRACAFLNEYFQLIHGANRELWDSGREGFICTNVGVQAYLMLAASIISHVTTQDRVVPGELSTDKLLAEVTPYLTPIIEKLDRADAAWAERHFKVQYGTGGRREYHYRLCRMVREIERRFCPPGYTQWREERSEERIERAESQIRDISIKVHAIIVRTLKAEYGSEEREYFEQGVKDRNVRVQAYERQQEDPKRLSLDNYLQFVDYEKIVKDRRHWPLFRNVFNIPEQGEKGLAKNLKWMNRINELRRIPAHPTGGRSFTMEDFDYLEWIHGEFFRRAAMMGEE